jgi:hypothetical protein
MDKTCTDFGQPSVYVIAATPLEPANLSRFVRLSYAFSDEREFDCAKR